MYRQLGGSENGIREILRVGEPSEDFLRTPGIRFLFFVVLSLMIGRPNIEKKCSTITDRPR